MLFRSPTVFRVGMGALLLISFATDWISTGLSAVINAVGGGLESLILPLFGL